MTVNGLLGLHVSLDISEPWEFETECGTASLMGLITDANDEQILIKLNKPITFQKNNILTAVCKPRHKGRKNNDLLHENKLHVNVLFLSAQENVLPLINSDNSIRYTAAIGTIKIIEK